MVRKSESHRTEDVLLLFRYTENPLKTPIFPPTALRVSAVVSRYTENSSFPYTPNVVASLRQPRLAQTPAFHAEAGFRERIGE